MRSQKPTFRWLRRIFRNRVLCLTLIFAVTLGIVFAAEYAYVQIHLNAGPNGWFAVDQLVGGYDASQGVRPPLTEHIIAGPFPNKSGCIAWGSSHSPPWGVVCKRMRYDDAAREGWNGAGP